MSGHLDSESVFMARLSALGIPHDQIRTLVAAKVNNMAKLAFLSSVQPGVADDSPFFIALAKALALSSPDDLSAGEQSAYRRAWFEASTVAIAEVRNKADKTSEDGPKKMPMAERSARHDDQQSRLTGIKIEGVLEPSHALLDKAWSMREEDQLKLITAEECTSRAQEVLGVKKDTFFRADTSGNLKQFEKEEDQKADMSTEYRVRLALTRRALAFDNVGLSSFDSMEDYHGFLYSLIMKEALDSHYPITVDQVLKADRQLFIRLVELTRNGILPKPNGRLPIDIALPTARLDPVFNAILQPLPRPASSSASAYAAHKAFNEGHAAAGPYQSGGKGRGKAKGKGKGKKGMGKGGRKGHGSGGGPGVPEELKGLRTLTNSGYNYCWACNLKEGCQQAKMGYHCPKGFHGCMKCGSKDHGYQQCPKK